MQSVDLKHERTYVMLACDIGFESRHSLLCLKTVKTIAHTKNMKNARPSILWQRIWLSIELGLEWLFMANKNLGQTQLFESYSQGE